MSYAKLIEKLQMLPKEKQMEVFDFIEFLSSRSRDEHRVAMTEWNDAEFSLFSLHQAMKDIEDEPALYRREDIKEKWQ